jgi:hypothetical protein
LETGHGVGGVDPGVNDRYVRLAAWRGELALTGLPLQKIEINLFLSYQDAGRYSLNMSDEAFLV